MKCSVSPDGKHVRERCTCDDPKCRRWVCVWCEDIIDRARVVSPVRGE